MAQKSLLWTTNGTGDGTGSGYTAEEMFQLFRSFCQNTNIGGVAPNVLNELAVTGTSSPVAVNTGQALVYGIPYHNTASVNVAVSTPAGDTRIDRVVLQADWTAQTVRIALIAGSEGGAAPSLTQTASTTWEIPLAQVSITTGGVITVTDEREWVGGVGDGTIVAAQLADYLINPRLHISGTNGIVVDPQNGNARGADAVDLQTERVTGAEVASGENATIAGGYRNTASGNHSMVGGGDANSATGADSTVAGGASNTASQTGAVVAGGGTNTASGTRAAVLGGFGNLASGNNASAYGKYAKADKRGQMAVTSDRFAATGDAQGSKMVALVSTTDATPTMCGIEKTLHLTIASDTTWAFTVLLVARRTDADGESAAYKFEGCIDNNAGTTALVGSVTKTVLAEDTVAWDADVTADNTNDSLLITVTGENSKTIYWVATVWVSEVTG